MKTLLMLFAAASGGLLPAVAQNAVSSTTSSLVRSSLAAASGVTTTGSPDLSAETKFRNRSRSFADRIVAGHEYWSLVDSDLHGKTADQELALLSPPAISTRNGLREMDILVSLKRNLTVFTTPDRPVDIGTATVNAKDVRSIAVTSIISIRGLTVVTK